MTQFSASEAALEGFRITRERPGTILGWGVVNFLGITVIGGLMLVTLGGPFVEFVKKGGLANTTPEALSGMIDKSWPAFVMLLAVVMLFMSILTAGIYRLVLRPGEKGFVHLRIGADELRLTLVNAVLFMAGLFCLGIVDLVGAAFAQSYGLPGAVAAALVVAAPMVWVGVRLCLATPMTFAEHRISLRAAWSLTRGRFWPLFGMMLLAAIFYAMVWVLILIIYTAVVALAGGAAALEALQRGVITPGAVVGLVAVLVLQLILPVLQWVMLYAPLAIAYRELHGPAADETF
jgi:hypothetical protein